MKFYFTLKSIYKIWFPSFIFKKRVQTPFLEKKTIWAIASQICFSLYLRSVRCHSESSLLNYEPTLSNSLKKIDAGNFVKLTEGHGRRDNSSYTNTNIFQSPFFAVD